VRKEGKMAGKKEKEGRGGYGRKYARKDGEGNEW
jgi:hypothetical protein